MLRAQQLKEATASHHQAIEAQPWARALLRPDLDLRVYAGVLFGWEGVLRYYRRRLAVDLALYSNYLGRLADFAAADLQALGLTAPARAITPVALPLELPTSYGVLYVILGSRFGSQWIARKLQQQQVGAAAQHIEFFAGGRGYQARLWPRLLRTLEATPWTESEWETVCNQAVATFEFISEQLSAGVARQGQLQA